MPDAYYGWLIQQIGDGYIEDNYQKLLWKLYSTAFVYELDYDRNRASDGLYLRKIFEWEMRFPCAFPYADQSPETCSVLEMMVALARKAEDDIMHDPDIGDRTGQWFWTFLQNLGLDIYDDVHYSESNVSRILNVFMHHLYAPNGGSGGMFSIKKCCRDMRKTDLWWQLNAYFEENYPISIW